LKNHPAPVQGLFFGLILASIFLVWKQIEEKNAASMALLVIGAIGAYVLVGAIPVQTPESLPFIFFVGMIAITAMILPGISGSFILLLLGKYVFILESLRNVIKMRSLGQDLVVVAVFCCGCLVGVLAFSRVLNWLLSKYNAATMAILTGLMIGSLRRIWPYQNYTVSNFKVGGKIKTKITGFENIIPSNWSKGYILALVLVFVGFALVFALDYVANKRGKKAEA